MGKDDPLHIRVGLEVSRRRPREELEDPAMYDRIKADMERIYPKGGSVVASYKPSEDD